MALSSTTLANAMKAELDSRFPLTTGIPGFDAAATRQSVCDALAVAIVTHFKTYADVVLAGGEFGITGVTSVEAEAVTGTVSAGTAAGALN